ncbi:casein kinase 1 [Trichoderma barbatum]
MSQQPQKHVINERWRIDGIIGQGGFGSVYIATDLTTNQIVAVKLQNLPSPPSPSQVDDLEYESLYYTLLRNHPGIAALYDNGRQPPHQFMVCELLGASLQSLFDRCGKKFSLKTTLMLADQLIQRLEAFHSRNLLHRDVKPDNFAMGLGKEKGKTAYILDFGLVGDYVNDEKFFSAPSYAFCGTYYWAAIAAHLDRSQSPKDDLESLAYMLIYFARGSLPWQGSADENESTDLMRERITRLKLTLPIDLICKDLPSPFARHLKYVRSLTYNDKPSYAKLRAMYRRLMKRLGYQNDGVFDWDLLESSGSMQLENAEQLVDMVPASIQGKPVVKRIKEEKEEKAPAKKKVTKVDSKPLAKKAKRGNKEDGEAKQQNKEPVVKTPPKRRIVFIKRADNEKTPPRRQRSKPAAAEKKKVLAKKTAANKIVIKRSPRKPIARIKAL